MLKGEQQGKYDLEFTTPAACADAVHRRQADDGHRSFHRISAHGRGRRFSRAFPSPPRAKSKACCFSAKVPIEKIKTVAVDNSSRTSAALVRILMRKFYSRFVTTRLRCPSPTTMLKRADAALVIGDPALTFDGKVPEVYDLAAEWKKFTGLPFVFALWVGRDDAKLARFRKDFEASRDFGLAHVDDIAAEYAPKLNMTPAGVKVYLTENIDYSLDEENRKGLRVFYRLARETGIIPVEKDSFSRNFA